MDETWKMIEERYDFHQKINATKSERIKDNLRRSYSELNKRIKQMVKKDKKKCTMKKKHKLHRMLLI